MTHPRDLFERTFLLSAADDVGPSMIRDARQRAADEGLQVWGSHPKTIEDRVVDGDRYVAVTFTVSLAREAVGL